MGTVGSACRHLKKSGVAMDAHKATVEKLMFLAFLFKVEDWPVAMLLFKEEPHKLKSSDKKLTDKVVNHLLTECVPEVQVSFQVTHNPPKDRNVSLDH